MEKVVPVFIGKFTPQSLSCIRSWGKQGFEVGFICVSEELKEVVMSRYLNHVVFLRRDQIGTFDGVRIVNNFLMNIKATGIIALEYRICYWINNISNIFPKNVRVWTMSNEKIRWLDNKVTQVNIAKKVGIDVLKTYLIDKNHFPNISEKHYPLCVRPAIPEDIEPTFKIKLVYSQEELKQLLKSLSFIKKPLVAQPFRQLLNLSVHGVRHSSGKMLSIQSFLVDFKQAGVGVRIRPFVLIEPLLHKCINFIDECGIIGVWEMDILYEPLQQKMYHLDLNVRYGGITSKAFCCGYDEPSLTLMAYDISLNKQYHVLPDKIVSDKQMVIIDIILNFFRKLNPVDYNGKSFYYRIWLQFITLLTASDESMDSTDLKGFFCLIISGLKKRF